MVGFGREKKARENQLKGNEVNRTEFKEAPHLTNTQTYYYIIATSVSR